MKLEDKMKEDGYVKKEILCCPHCGEVLDDDSYDEHTEYHNCIEGTCKKCGHSDHWSSFFKEVYVKG